MGTLDERTFGKSLAAIDMAKIVNERGLNPRKAGRLLNRFNKIVSDLDGVNVTTAIHVMHLVYKESSETCSCFEEPLNTYTQNILSGKFKEWQVRKNTRIPKNRR